MRSGAALLTASGPAANTKSLNAMTEAEISDKITTLLSRYGITPWQQHAIPSRSTAKKIGSCDLYIHDKRAIIEVKRLKRLENGPHSPESGDNGRSAFDQLERYVKAERSQSNARLLDFVGGDPGQASHWVGIVTNFKKWWAWTWPLSASADDGKLQDSFDGVELAAPKERQLIALLQRKTARPVPVELGPMFEPRLKRFLDLYDRVRDYRDTQTQKGLWFKQLEAGGNAPDADADEIFVRHTLLILATRLISKAVGGYEDDAITRGFVCWVSEGGGGEVKSLAADVESYGWNHETRDIMRSLYMGFIPKKHRKSYGEYYTPDWLAEKLAMAVIDEKYIREQLESFQSDGAVRPVLDPACGSGALLYHAGRRILNSKAVGEARQYMDPAKISEFLCAMLYGIDIHPVAVEMAKTDICRLVRYAPDRHIRVYQGDSPLLNRPTANMHSSAIAGPDDLVLYSPKGTTPVLPKLFPKSSESIDAGQDGQGKNPAARRAGQIARQGRRWESDGRPQGADQDCRRGRQRRVGVVHKKPGRPRAFAGAKGGQDNVQPAVGPDKPDRHQGTQDADRERGQKTRPVGGRQRGSRLRYRGPVRRPVLLPVPRRSEEKRVDTDRRRPQGQGVEGPAGRRDLEGLQGDVGLGERRVRHGVFYVRRVPRDQDGA